MSKPIAILHISDLHFHPLSKFPRSTKSNFHLVVKDEFAELGLQVEDLKKDYDVKIAITGDIFNLKTQSLYIPKFIEYYSSLLEKTFSDLQIFCIPGNHDLEKSSYDLVSESAYNLLCKATKNIIDISNKTYSLSNKIKLIGIPYYNFATTKDKLSLLDLSSENSNVLFLHTDIFKDSSQVSWYLENYLTHKELVDLVPNLDLVLMGHIHAETTPYFIENSNKKTWFSKPHAFSRMSKDYLSKDDLESSFPSYSISYFDSTETLIKTEIKKIRKYKASDFIDFDDLAKIKESSNKFNSFISELKSNFGTIEESFSILSPEDVYNKLTISQEVKDILNKYLS